MILPKASKAAIEVQTFFLRQQTLKNRPADAPCFRPKLIVPSPVLRSKCVKAPLWAGSGQLVALADSGFGGKGTETQLFMGPRAPDSASLTKETLFSNAPARLPGALGGQCAAATSYRTGSVSTALCGFSKRTKAGSINCPQRPARSFSQPGGSGGPS
ncbi:hypothetical protein ACJZ2D_014624 [Fusarium nematophilum]